jgi:hypothetical protein
MFVESLFLPLALSSLSLCTNVFFDTASLVVKKRVESKSESAKEEYNKQLYEFAKEACKTQNPDVFWLLAFVESSFTFEVVRFNKENPDIFYGSNARKSIKKISQSENVDIGVLQINWRYHHKQVGGGKPSSLLEPATAVKAAASILIEEKATMCSNWLVCYHNANPRPGAKYAAQLKKAHKSLKENFSRVVKTHNVVVHEASTDTEQISPLRSGF